MRGIFVLGLLALAVGGCVGDDAFQCVSDDQCSPNGTCEANEYCSFPDTSCTSGQRFGDQAATGIAGQCVPEDLGSTGVVTASGSSSSAVSDVTTDEGSTFAGGISAGDDTASGGEWSGSTGGSTGFGSSSSGGGLDCSAVPATCDDCFDCEVVEGAACTDQGIDCALTTGCTEIYSCLRACGVEGLCNEDCCFGEPAVIDVAFALMDCQAGQCGPLDVCEGADSPACG